MVDKATQKSVPHIQENALSFVTHWLQQRPCRRTGRTLFDLFEDITVHGEAHLAVWSEPSNGEFEGILVGTLCPTELCLFAGPRHCLYVCLTVVFPVHAR